MNDQIDPGSVAGAEMFSVGATASLQEQRPRTLKHGDMFGVFDHAGNVLSGHGEPGGLYYRDTRHLSQLDLLLAGLRPLLLSSDVREDNATLTCDLTNPDLREGEVPEAGTRPRAYPPHHVPVRGGVLRTPRGAQLCRHRPDAGAGTAFRRRFRRSVRGARPAPSPARYRPPGGLRGRESPPVLHRARRRAARDAAALRPGARPAGAGAGGVRAAPAARRACHRLCRGELRGARGRAAARARQLFHRDARRPPRAAPLLLAGHRHRDRQRHLQRVRSAARSRTCTC